MIRNRWQLRLRLSYTFIHLITFVVLRQYLTTSRSVTTSVPYIDTAHLRSPFEHLLSPNSSNQLWSPSFFLYNCLC
ncbi:hypothetical protein VTL71DRAFT_1588 [Oculimacula yallundae]|uniref:Uncharacterized protein n=1 Tax=Oculimacula yallundae TaxID=86028 RepID=A0ABR4CB41_9HELO